MDQQESRAEAIRPIPGHHREEMDGAGPQPLGFVGFGYLGRCPRLRWRRAFGAGFWRLGHVENA
jgi:hypothetical protein